MLHDGSDTLWADLLGSCIASLMALKTMSTSWVCKQVMTGRGTLHMG